MGGVQFRHAVLLLLTAACAGQDAADGCKKDNDCKGDRVCVNHQCVAGAAPVREDGAEVKKAGATSAKAASNPASKAAAAPSKPASVFRAVRDESQWVKRLGPKMKAGSSVAHTVFEGPFGPSPKSHFALTKRADNTFFALVMGDDGKGWPAGPLAEPQIDLAHKIEAVSFFDADGNGSTDALVMATYKSASVPGPYPKNILLR